MDKMQLLQKAVKQYGLNFTNMMIEKELQPNSHHGDLHFKILVDNKFFSARFIGENRYETDVFIKLSDEVLCEQMRFCKYLLDSGIPFMKQVIPLNGEPFLSVEDAGKQWKFVLFEWIEGKHITHGTESIAEKFGAFAQQIHNISSEFDSVVFPKESHIKGYEHFYDLLCSHAKSAFTSPANELLKRYLNEVNYNIEKAKTNSYDFLVQSDLNPLNIIWNEDEEIIGVVDFESITYTDRIEGLAWLIKWYSRTHGITSHEMSPTLAKSLLRGYGAEDLLSQKDFERLPSLLWLSGCLNWNFTAKTIELIKSKEEDLLKEHLIKYFNRGEMLLSLI